MSLHLIALDIARRTPSLVNVGGLLEVKFKRLWKIMANNQAQVNKYV